MNTKVGPIYEANVLSINYCVDPNSCHALCEGVFGTEEKHSKLN